MRFSNVMMFAAACLGASSVASAKDAAPTTLSMPTGAFAPMSDAQFGSARLRVRDHAVSVVGGTLIGLAAGGVAGLTIGLVTRDTKYSCYNARGALTPCGAV